MKVRECASVQKRTNEAQVNWREWTDTGDWVNLDNLNMLARGFFSLYHVIAMEVHYWESHCLLGQMLHRTYIS